MAVIEGAVNDFVTLPEVEPYDTFLAYWGGALKPALAREGFTKFVVAPGELDGSGNALTWVIKCVKDGKRHILLF